MSNELETVAIDQLHAVHGGAGLDFSAAHRAGMTQMQTGRVPPPYQTPQQQMRSATGPTQCLLQPATPGVFGYASGFARNMYQQLTTPSQPQAPQPQQP